MRLSYRSKGLGALVGIVGLLVLTTCTQPGLGSKVDITAPKVKITTPSSNGSYLKGTIHLAGNASDDLGITALRVTYPTSTGDKVADVTLSGTSWTLDLDSVAAGGLADGKDSIVVAATDASGKVTTDSVLVYVDNKAPTVLVTSPSSYGASPPTYSDYVDIKGEAWDASPISRVDLTLYYAKSGPQTLSKQADGTNTWSVRFFLKNTAPGFGPLGAGDDQTLSYSVSVTDVAGNVSTTYYHSQDIYQILNTLPAGTLFPTTLELGTLDQAGTGTSSPTNITFAALNAVRINGSSPSARANLNFSNTSLPTIQYSNLDPASPPANTLAPGSVIVGNVIPPANAGSIDSTTLQFELFTSAAFYNVPQGAPVITLTEASPHGTQLALTNLGSSQGFKVTLKDAAGVNLLPGPYVIQVSGKANGSGTATSSVQFGIDASAPVFTESNIGNSLTLKNSQFTLSGSASSGVGLSNLLVEESSDGGSTFTTAYNHNFAGNPNTSTYTTTNLPITPTDGSYNYRMTLTPTTGATAILYRSVIYDATAPTLNVTSPAPASSATTASISVAGTAGDGSGTGVSKVYYLVDAATVDHSADVTAWAAGTPTTAAPSGWSTTTGLTSSWTGSATLGTEGSYRLWVVSVDKVGNTDTLALHSAGSFVNGTTYTIETLGTTDFTAIGAASNTVGLSFTATGAGSGTGEAWSGTGQLVPFSRDDLPPKLTLTAPPAVVNLATGATFTLSGTTSDTNTRAYPDVTVQYTKNGVPQGGAFSATVDTSGALRNDPGNPWSWTFTVDTATHTTDGDYVFTVTATDGAGKTTTKTGSLTIDTKVPTSAIVQPASYTPAQSQYWLSGTTTSFSGTATDPATSSFNLVSQVYTKIDTKGTSHSGDNPLTDGWSLAAGAANWSTTVDLTAPLFSSEGQFTLWTAAYDNAGNRSVLASRDFGVDQSAPTLTETARAATSSANAVFTLTGSVADANALATLTATESKDGGAAVALTLTPSVAIAGAKSATYITQNLPKAGVADGSYVYTLTATDAAGKTATVTRTVVIDTTPPTVSISQPGNYLASNPSYWHLGTTANLSGSATDAVSGVATVYYTIDAVGVDHSADVPSATWTAASGSTSWSTSVNLVTLGEGKHTFWVAAYDGAGNLSTLSHQDFGVDQGPPTVTETLLPDASQHIKNGAFVLTGSVNDTNGASTAAAGTLTVSVSVNGGAATAATVVGNTWSYSQAATDGIYSYVITAQDAASKTASVNRLVLLDTTPPTVAVTTPTPGLWTSSSSLSIAGTAQDGAGAGINKTYYLVDAAANDHSADIATWNSTSGTAAPVSGTAATWTLAGGLPTAWTGSATLATEGSVRLWAVSADKAGNTTVLSGVAVDGSTWTGTGAVSQFGYDLNPPTLTETSVATASTVIRNASVGFAGTAVDTNALSSTHPMTVSVDGGAAVDLTVTAGAWSYNYSVNTVTHGDDGTHSLVFTATDAAGKTTTITRSVLVDTTPDTATVTAPGPGAWTNQATPTLAGTAGNGTGSGVAQVWVLADDAAVSHAGDATATIPSGGVWQQATGTSNWSKAWTLSTEGSKKLWVAVLDNAGNWSPVFTVLGFGYDTTSPSLTLTALGGYKTTFSLTGTVSDAASSVATLLVKIDSGSFNAVTVAANWTWAVPAGTFTGLSEGSHTVTVLATDGAGNQSTQTGSFNKDTLAPSLSYNNISAGGGTVVQDAAPVLAGSLTDPSGVASATYDLDVWNTATATWNAVATGAVLGAPGLATNWSWTLDLSATGLGLPDGKYRVAIGSTDGAANAIAAPLNVTFLLSRTNPAAALLAPSLGTFQNAAFTLTGTASDPNGVTTVKAKLASGSVDFSSGTTAALPALPVTVATGSPGVFTTLAPHGLADGTAVYVWGTPMPVTPSGALSTSTAYYLKYLTPTTFQLSATVGGAGLAINTSLATNVMVASASWSFATFHPNWPVTVSGSTVTAANHGLSVGDVVYFAGTTLPTPATAATPYYVVASTSSTFQVSATSGGAALTFTGSGTSVTVSSPTQPVKWMVPSLSVSSFTDGALTAFAQVASGSGKTSQTSRDFTLDTTAPTVALTSPVSGTRQVGNLSLIGTTSDGGAIPSGVTGTIQYQIGKNAILGNPLSWTNAGVTGGAYSWTIALGSMSSFANATSATECDTSGNPASGTNLWKLPIYFQAVDVAGNVAQKTDYYLILDPNGNIPVVTLLQPSQNGLTYGGQQRVTGMASQPVWVHDVEVAVDPTGGSNFPAASVPVTLSGSTLNATAHGFANGRALYFAGSTLPQIGGVPVSVTTPYFVVNSTANTLQLALTTGGSPVTFSNSPAGVTVSVWTAATLTSTGSSVTWYADVNQNNVYPQGGASQTVSIQARAWNSPTAGGARGTLSGLLNAPLTMTFDSTFPKVQNIVISPNSNPSDPEARTYFSQITTKDHFHVLANVVSSKGINKIERVESSPLTGTTALYDAASSYASTSTVTAPTVATSGAFPFGANYQLIITSLGTTDWQAIGAPAGASVGTMFKPTGAGGIGGGQALTSDSSGNFTYVLDLAIDSTTLYNNTSGVYSFDLRVTDMTSPQSQVSLQNITLNEDNFYPTSTVLSSSTLVGSSFKIQGTATDVGSGSGPIAGLSKVVVYLMRGAAILNMATGVGTSSGTTVSAMDMANGGVIGSVTYPPTESGTRNYSASIDDRNEIGVSDHNGDGFQESLLTNGNGLDWWTQLNTANLADGPVEVHYVVWDSAGNATHYKQTAFISNAAPSITSVDLGTDLNGDGTVAAGEVTTGITSYAATNFSARNNRLSFKVNTVSGNYPLSYSIKYAGTELNGTMTSSTLTLTNFASIPDSAGTNDRSFVIVVSDSTLGSPQTSTVTVNLTIQNNDTVPPVLSVAPFGQRYTVPLDSANGNAYTDTGKVLTAVGAYTDNVPTVGTTLQGHVEYAADNVWHAGVPALSGQVIFRGRAADNQRISSIKATIVGYNGGAGLSQPFTIASWSGSALVGQSGTGWSFASDASSEGVSQADGHALNWAFTWDSSGLSTVTGSAVVVSFQATDFNTNVSSVASLTVDVVPYVVRVDTGLSTAYKNNPSAFNRTALGRYPVADSETLVLNGFNLNGASTTATIAGVSTNVVVAAPAAVSAGNMIKGFPYTITTVGTTNFLLYGAAANTVGTSFTATAAGAGTGTVTTDAKHSARVTVGTTVVSGALAVSVAGAPAANNSNLNTRSWNSQSNGLNNLLLTDDLALDVWKFNNITSAGVTETTAKYPTMRISPNAAQDVTFAYGHSESDFRLETNSPATTQLWETSPSKYAWTSLAYDQATTPNVYATAIDTDRTNNGYDGNTSTKFNFFSRQIGGGAGYPGSYQSGTFKRLLEANWNGTQYDSLRSQYPDMVATSPATIVDPAVNVAGSPAKIYLTYYDNLNSQTKFRYGTVGVSGDTVGMGLQEWVGTAHGGVSAPPYSAGFQNEGTVGAPIALSPYTRFASVTAGGNAYYSFSAVAGHTYLVRLYGQTTGTLAANADVYGYQNSGFAAANASSVLAGTAMETFTMAATGATIWVKVTGVAATAFALAIQDTTHQNEGTVATPIDTPRDTGSYGLVTNTGISYYRLSVVPNAGYQFRLDNVSAGARLDVYTGSDFATGQIVTNGAATPAAPYNNYQGTYGYITGASQTYLYAKVTGTAGAGVISTYRFLYKEAGSSYGYQEIAGPNDTKKAGPYAAVGVTSTGVAVVAWYDKPNTQLYYSYNTDPANLKGSSESQWQTNAISLDPDFSGWNVSLDVDGADHIHIAYYNSSNGDLRYVYIPSYSGTPTNPITVDSFLSTGTDIMLKTKLVSGNYVPYIVYYEGALTATKNSMRLAYRINFTVLNDGSNPANDQYTGDWEVGTIPVQNIPKDYKFSIGFKTLGSATNSPIVGYATESTLETGQLK